MPPIENRPFDPLRVGEEKRLVHVLTNEDFSHEMARILLGARAPIMLASRADNTITRLGSCAIALIPARHRVAQAP